MKTQVVASQEMVDMITKSMFEILIATITSGNNSGNIKLSILCLMFSCYSLAALKTHRSGWLCECMYACTSLLYYIVCYQGFLFVKATKLPPNLDGKSILLQEAEFVL